MFSVFRRFFSGASTYSSANMVSAQATALEMIQNHPLMVFSKSSCPYCGRTKEALKSLIGEKKWKELMPEREKGEKEFPDSGLYEIDLHGDEGEAIHMALKQTFDPIALEKDGFIMKKDVKGKYLNPNHRTVPNVWVGKEQIGGNDDVQAAIRDGSMKQKLQDAGVL